MWRAPEDRLFVKYRRRRDPALLARVFDHTAPGLWRVARHLTGQRHEADDLVQQVYLIAIERADHWDAERGLFPWLVGILTNQARLARRTARRAVDPERLGEPEAVPLTAMVEGRELHDAIARAVAELGDVYRPALHLHLFHGLNAKEIADALDRPAGTVRTQLVRGLERLRRALPIGLGIAAATTSACAASSLLAIRRTLLERHTPYTAAGGLTAAALLTIGGSTMKKWLLLATIVLLLGLGTWQGLRTAYTDPAPPTATAPNAVEAELAVAVDRSADQPLVATHHDPADPAERTVAPLSGSLSVRCTAADGDDQVPVSGAWIRLQPVHDAFDGSARLGARTDADGRARFDELPVGEWRVSAFADLSVVKDTVQIEPEQLSELTLTVDGTPCVAVEVVDERGSAVPDAELWVGIALLGRVSPLQVMSRLAARTDAHGRARLPAGRMMHIGARKDGYAASLASPTDGVGDERITLVLRDGPGTLLGEVVDELGRALADESVLVQMVTERQPSTARRTADGRAALAAPVAVFAHSDTNGQFVVPGLWPGRYRCMAVDLLELEKAVEVDVESHARTAVRVVLPRTVRLVGRVLRLDGRPAAGLHVHAFTSTDQRVTWGHSLDGEGRFAIAAPRTALRLEVRRGERVLTTVRVTPSDDAEPLLLTVDEPLSVAGRLVDPDGAHMVGWNVIAVDQAAAFDARKLLDSANAGVADRTDADGRFELWGLDAGPFAIVAQRAADLRRGLPPPVVRRGVATGTRDLELVVPAAAVPHSVLTGRLVDAVGAPVPVGTVQILRDGRFESNDLRDGRFRIEDLTWNDYTLHLLAAGHASRVLQVTLRDRETALGDLVLEPSVVLRVRPEMPADTVWRGLLPRPSVRHEDGSAVSPRPATSVVGDEVVIDGLPPGRYVLSQPAYDDIVAEPVPFELLPGVPLQLDWPIRIGRRVTLCFATDATSPRDTADVLHVVVREVGGNEVLARDVAPGGDGGWRVDHLFAPGKYTIEAGSRSGLRFHDGNADTAGMPNGGSHDVPRAR